MDFYSASTYTMLGIDLDLFTPIFAVSRISGWAAHVIEQLDDNRLIGPRAEYIGPDYPVNTRRSRSDRFGRLPVFLLAGSQVSKERPGHPSIIHLTFLLAAGRRDDPVQA